MLLHSYIRISKSKYNFFACKLLPSLELQKTQKRVQTPISDLSDFHNLDFPYNGFRYMC